MKAPSSVVLDHLRYIKFRPYRRRTNAAIRRMVAENPKGLSYWTVMHEHDDSCCRRQPWQVTRTNLLRSLAEDGLTSALVAPATATGATAPRETP